MSQSQSQSQSRAKSAAKGARKGIVTIFPDLAISSKGKILSVYCCHETAQRSEQSYGGSLLDKAKD